MKTKRRRTVSPEKARAAIMGRGWYESIPLPARDPHPTPSSEEIASPTAPGAPVGREEDPFPG